MALKPAVLVGDRFDRAAEADLEGAFAPLELPGIAVIEPGLRQFDLPAVMDLLAEHAVDVADAIAMRRDVDGRHAFHEAGGEPAEAAIAERRVRLQRGDEVEVDAERRQRLAHVVHQAEIGEGVAHQAADQEFQRQVIDALVAVLVGLLVDCIHWSMMRSRTTLIEAVSQSYCVATAGPCRRGSCRAFRISSASALGSDFRLGASVSSRSSCCLVGSDRTGFRHSQSMLASCYSAIGMAAQLQSI